MVKNSKQKLKSLWSEAQQEIEDYKNIDLMTTEELKELAESLIKDFEMNGMDNVEEDISDVFYNIRKEFFPKVSHDITDNELALIGTKIAKASDPNFIRHFFTYMMLNTSDETFERFKSLHSQKYLEQVCPTV